MHGAIAQLGERVNGIHEVSGSIPLGSTIPYPSPSRPYEAGLRVANTTPPVISAKPTR